jgi:hypothetical protein
VSAYAAIGSRRTPIEIQLEMTYIANRLQKVYTLRSGAADGADKAFELGVTEGNKEIFIPWKGFNNSDSLLYNVPMEAMELSKKYHSRWELLSQAAKKLMARNACQVLGYNLDDPVVFVLAWTPDGCESNKTRNKDTGGTGQAISIAEAYDIPVINMKNWNWKDRLIDITGINL